MSEGTDPIVEKGQIAVPTGLIGLGKLSSTNSALCPHDALVGQASADGADACEHDSKVSCDKTGHALQQLASPKGMAVLNASHGDDANGVSLVDAETVDILILVGCKCEVESTVVGKRVEGVVTLIEQTNWAKVVVGAVQVIEPAECTDGIHIVLTV